MINKSKYAIKHIYTCIKYTKYMIYIIYGFRWSREELKRALCLRPGHLRSLRLREQRLHSRPSNTLSKSFSLHRPALGAFHRPLPGSKRLENASKRPLKGGREESKRRGFRADAAANGSALVPSVSRSLKGLLEAVGLRERPWAPAMRACGSS